MSKIIKALMGATMLAGISLSAAPASAAMTRWDTTSKGWEIDAYDNSGTCAAFRSYDDGISIMIGWRRNNDGTDGGGMRFTLIRKSWADAIKKDQTYTIRAVTDGKSWPPLEFIGSNPGTGQSAGLMSAGLVDIEFLTALAKANVVHFYQDDRHILGLQLDGSQEAIIKTLACQQAQDAKRQPPSQPNLTQPGNTLQSPWAVPILRHGTQITLNGKANDQVEINFTLDTGATAVSITQEQANRLGLKPVRQVTVEYADGRKGVEDVVIIDKLMVGGTVFVRNIEATVSGNSALLGKNFLDRFGSYEIDNRSAKLVLRK